MNLLGKNAAIAPRSADKPTIVSILESHLSNLDALADLAEFDDYLAYKEHQDVPELLLSHVYRVLRHYGWTKDDHITDPSTAIWRHPEYAFAHLHFSLREAVGAQRAALIDQYA